MGCALGRKCEHKYSINTDSDLSSSGVADFGIGDCGSVVSRSGCPGTLVVLLQMEGSEKDETALHQRFVSARERGEWFRPVPELLLVITEAKLSQLEEEKAELQAAFDALRQRVDVARAQLGSLSVFAEESVGIALRNIKEYL